MTDRPIHAATIREWRDISSAALPPGWVNVYELPNGRVNWLPCPGVLTQELIGKCTYYSDRTFEDSEPGDDDFNPETRIVFAVPRGLRPQPPNGQHQPNCPTLIPADDGGDPEDIYLATVTADDAEANWGRDMNRAHRAAPRSEGGRAWSARGATTRRCCRCPLIPIPADWVEL